jgi:hypothetical protein
LFGLLAVAGSLVASPVAAEPKPSSGAETAPADQLAAREDFREGSRLAQSDDWAGALERYTASQARYPHATTLYNIGYCHERLGDFAAAARDTQAALLFEERFPGRGLSDELRTRGSEALREFAAKVVRVVVVAETDELAVRVDRRALEVFDVDGRPVGFVASEGAGEAFSPVRGGVTLTLTAGSHVLEWQTKDGVRERELTLVAGGAVRLTLPEAPSDEAPRASVATGTSIETLHAPAADDRAPAPDATPGRPLRTVGIVSLAAGGSAALVGLGAGLLAAATKRDLDAACTSEGSCPPDQADRIDQFHAQATVATVAFASAVVLGGLGVTLVLVESRPKQRALVRLRVGSEVTLTGHF